MRNQRLRKESGLSILEMVIGTAIFLVVMGPVAQITLSAVSSLNEFEANSDVETRGRRAADRLDGLFRGVSSDSLDLVPDYPAWTSDATLERIGSVDLVAGSAGFNGIRVRWQIEASETNDGNDNDGDGLVDEGELVVTYDAGEITAQEIVLARGVPEFLEGEDSSSGDQNSNGLTDEAGLCITRVDDSIVFRLTLSSVLPGDEIRLHTISRTVRVRN